MDFGIKVLLFVIGCFVGGWAAAFDHRQRKPWMLYIGLSFFGAVFGLIVWRFW